MSGAVKGKGVIMKKTCIEINEMMTDLMQQIENLNAKKVGLFCNLGKDFREDFEINEQLKEVNNELLEKYSIFFGMISNEKDFRDDYFGYLVMTKKSYDEIIESLTCIRKEFTHFTDIFKVESSCLKYYKKIVNLITMCVELEAENDN